MKKFINAMRERQAEEESFVATRLLMAFWAVMFVVKFVGIVNSH